MFWFQFKGVEQLCSFVGEGEPTVAEPWREDVTALTVLDVADSPRAAHDEGRLADKVCGHRAFEVQLKHALVHGLSAMQVVCEWL